MIQAFAREGKHLPDGYVDQSLNSIIAENYAGDRKAFMATIRERGVTVKTYRKEIADNWIITRMRQDHPEPGWAESLLKTADVTIY